MIGNAESRISRKQPLIDVRRSGHVRLIFRASFNVTFLNVKKSNQKKPPVSRFFLRVALSNGSRGNAPRLSSGSDSPRA